MNTGAFMATGTPLARTSPLATGNPLAIGPAKFALDKTAFDREAAVTK